MLAERAADSLAVTQAEGVMLRVCHTVEGFSVGFGSGLVGLREWRRMECAVAIGQTSLGGAMGTGTGMIAGVASDMGVVTVDTAGGEMAAFRI
jgi:hypothetical protein